MSAELINGKEVALRLRGDIAEKTRILKEATGVAPGLTAVLVGDDPASATYVRMKGKACDEVGFASRIVNMSEDTSQDELLELVADLNRDNETHGILVQLPLPDQIDSAAIINAVDPDKDVDGFHPVNVGRIVLGETEAGFPPATPAGIMRLLAASGTSLKGAEAVVIGRSNIVGKPIAFLLLHQHATVTICHSRTVDLAEHCRRADVLIAAVGRAGIVTGDMVKPGATVIDVGTNRIEDADGKKRLVGDVDFDSVVEVAGFLTPVPGGVGPMTIAMLLQNTLTSAQRATQG